jgi:mRNA-degrading endonuclease RelE of RelBE toxin-antitoxin system
LSSGDRKGKPFEIVMAPSALKGYKKFELPLQNKIKEEAKAISIAPHEAKSLSGPLEGIFSHRFSFNHAQYRIAYQINEADHVIEILLVKSRENFYQKLLHILE